MKRLSQYLIGFISHPSFPFLVAAVGFLDMFLFVFPNDLLMVSEAIFSPKRWKASVLIVALGSAAGAVALAWALHFGDSAFFSLSFHLASPDRWAGAKAAFHSFGALALFFGAALPIPVQPFVAAAHFSELNLLSVFGLVFCGRILKYSALAMLARFRPGIFGHRLPAA